MWGNTKSKEIERIHLKFCKTVLGVKLSTSNVGVYGELCRYPLYINRHIRMIKYWFKLVNTQNCILKVIYNSALLDCTSGLNNWVTKVKSLLDNMGFSYIWNDPQSVCESNLCAIFKQAELDCFIQKWQADVQRNGALTLYKYVKPCVQYSCYLDKVRNRWLRSSISKLVLSSHPLRIETGRYGANRTVRHERLCQLCNIDDLEDEYHFVIRCPVFDNIRQKYIKRYLSEPSQYVQILDFTTIYEQARISKSGKFITEAFALRRRLTMQR